jgi:glycosyltransferase involved in cell wall biosynthesis
MISAVILTKNEENQIGDCIRALDFCDEIILVDDNSSDKTQELAKEKKAKIFVRDMNMNYSQQSNFGLEKARGEWVLFIDADERISEKLRDEIIYALKNESDNAGYFLKRIDYIWGKWLRYGDVNKFKSLRLVRKDSGHWKRRVHPFFSINGKTKTLVNPILHYPHQSITEFIIAVNRWSTWHALANYEEGKKSSLNKIFLYPIMKFILNYLFRLGFLDGIQGLVFSIIMSFHSYLSWSKLWLIQNKKNQA